MSTKIFITIWLALITITTSAQQAEKVLLVTDKQWYYAGEPVWFSVNLLNACTDSLSQISKVVYIELEGPDNKPVYQLKVSINEANGHGSFLVADNLITGNYTLQAYTRWMKNFDRAGFTRKPVHIINAAKPAALVMANEEQHPLAAVDNMPVAVTTNKKIFDQREKITLKINTGRPARTSVSVYRLDSLQKISHPIYSGQPTDPCAVIKPFPTSTIMEKRTHMVVCRVTDRKSQQAVAGVRGYLSIIGMPDNLYVATSDSLGTIRFEVNTLIGKNELVLQTNRHIDSNYSIELINPYLEPEAHRALGGKTDVFDKMPAVIDDAMMGVQVQRIFNDYNNIKTSAPVRKSVPFYGKPDASYLMSDYVHFSTVEEILREYVTTVGVQRENGKPVPMVTDILSGKPLTGKPLILVNGVPVFDIDRFMNMNTDDFERISVVGRKYFMGHEMFYGIIDVRLNIALKDFGRNATVIDYEGPMEDVPFSSPSYAAENDRKNRKPDFRNVLYWNPRIDTDNSGISMIEFYTSDLEGQFGIVVNAIFNDGKTTTGNTIIQVK